MWSVRDLVEDIITVSEEEIITAMQLVWERMKIVIEASSAVALAAALSQKFVKQSGGVKRVGIVFSGGNVSFDKVPFLKPKAPAAAAATIEVIPSKL